MISNKKLRILAHRMIRDSKAMIGNVDLQLAYHILNTVLPSGDRKITIAWLEAWRYRSSGGGYFSSSRCGFENLLWYQSKSAGGHFIYGGATLTNIKTRQQAYDLFKLLGATRAKGLKDTEESQEETGEEDAKASGAVSEGPRKWGSDTGFVSFNRPELNY